MELTALPAEEWAQVVKDAEGFWDEVATASPRAGKVVAGLQGLHGHHEEGGLPLPLSRRRALQRLKGLRRWASGPAILVPAPSASRPVPALARSIAISWPARAAAASSSWRTIASMSAT